MGTWSLASKTDSRFLNNTYLNNFKKTIQIKNFEIKKLICTPTLNNGLF